MSGPSSIRQILKGYGELTPEQKAEYRERSRKAREDAERESAIERLSSRRQAFIQMLPARYQEIPTLETTAWNKEGFQAVDDYVKGDLNGIAFISKPGTGKTVLACKVLHDLFNQEAKKPNGIGYKFVMFKSVPEMLTELRDSYSSQNKVRHLDIVKQYVDYEHLVLDDLGAEKTTDWTTEVLYMIINGRYEARKGIIITSNCSPSELAGRLGERVVSRLAEMCRLVKFREGSDWRMNNWK